MPNRLTCKKDYNRKQGLCQTNAHRTHRRERRNLRLDHCGQRNPKDAALIHDALDGHVAFVRFNDLLD
jgi:hypothetical protein